MKTLCPPIICLVTTLLPIDLPLQNAHYTLQGRFQPDMKEMFYVFWHYCTIVALLCSLVSDDVWLNHINIISACCRLDYIDENKCHNWRSWHTSNQILSSNISNIACMSVFNFPIAFFLAPENNCYDDMFDDKHVVVSPSSLLLLPTQQCRCNVPQISDIGKLL